MATLLRRIAPPAVDSALGQAYARSSVRRQGFVGGRSQGFGTSSIAPTFSTTGFFLGNMLSCPMAPLQGRTRTMRFADLTAEAMVTLPQYLQDIGDDLPATTEVYTFDIANVRLTDESMTWDVMRASKLEPLPRRHPAANRPPREDDVVHLDSDEEEDPELASDVELVLAPPPADAGSELNSDHSDAVTLMGSTDSDAQPEDALPAPNAEPGCV